MASWFGKPNVEVYDDVHVNFLPLNYAYVILNTTLEQLGVYSVSEECYKCPYKRQIDENNDFGTDHTALYKIYTGEQTKWRILKHSQGDFIQPGYVSGLICELKPTLAEYGVYRLDVGRCAMKTEVSPVNIYLPLLLFCLIILSTTTLFGLLKLFLSRKKERYNVGLNPTARQDNSDIMPSLHFLRGVLLILIIFATTGCGGYPVFSKDYGGLTVANCLLLAYTFSIGLKVPIMFEEDSRRGMSKWSMFGVVVLRSFVLFVIGIAISAAAPRSRFLAVPLWAPLPCLAVAYLVVATCYMIGAKKQSNKPMNSIGTAGTLFWSCFLGAILVTIMIGSIYVFYYTECKPYTVFDPRRTPWMAQGNNCQEDDVFSEVFNKNLLRVNRDEPFYIDYYYAFTKALLGVISYVLIALVGLKAGVIYLQIEDQRAKMRQWCVWAGVFGSVGSILAAASGPLHFNLWPISTIFIISSVTLLIYIFIYHLTEVRQFSSIITTCGVGSIATLSGHLLFSQTFPFYWGIYLDTHFFYLWQSAWIVCLWILITICWMKLRTYLITKIVSDEGARRAVFAW